MKKINKVLKCIIFLILGIFIFQVLSYIFVPKWIDPIDPATARIKEYYNEKPNTIDVIFVGNSETSMGYSPITVWQKYGITSYNYGSSYQTTQIAYYKLQECLKYQNPKIILLETNSFFDIASNEEANRKVLNNFKLDDVTLNAILDKNVDLDNRLSCVFPLLRFHSRWNQLQSNDFKISLKKEFQTVQYKGMPMNVKKSAYNGDKDYMREKGKIEKIPEKNLNYVEKIIKLCEDKKIKLFMVEIPKTIWSLEKNKAIIELANNYGIDFIDFNLMQNQISLDWNNDTYDAGGHMNVYGAEKVSSYIGQVLSEKYNLEDHRNNKEIADDWNETARRYEERKLELEKSIINNKK